MTVFGCHYHTVGLHQNKNGIIWRVLNTCDRAIILHNLAPVLENNTHEPLWDFEIYTDHLVSAKRRDQKKRLAKLLILLSRLTTE